MEAGHLTERAKIRFLRRLGKDAPGMLLVSLADFLASRGPAATPEREGSFFRLLDSLLELYFQRDAASVSGRSLVTGKDLIDALGISPGPMVGRLLRLLEEARVQGDIRNRDEALQLARSLLDEML
jgi:poly(A) polymerase